MSRTTLAWGSMPAAPLPGAPPDKPIRPGFFRRVHLSLVAGGVAVLLMLYAAAVGGLALASILLLSGDLLGELLPWPWLAWPLQLLFALCTVTGLLLLLKGLMHVDRIQRAVEKASATMEPDLFELTAYIADAVDAPCPASIEFDCGSEVTARFDGVSGFLANRVVLHIGLSAAAALSTRELAGTMTDALSAHANGTGARRAALIAATHRLLSRAATGGDTVERMLVRMTRNGFVARWVGRGLLHLSEAARREVGWLERKVSGLSRSAMLARRRFQDECIQFVVGLDTAQLQRRRQTVRAAVVETAAHLRRNWEKNRLAYPSLPDVVARTARTRYVALPPSAGLIGCETPAIILFGDFPRRARRLSLACYRLQFGLPVSADRLSGGVGGSGPAAAHLYDGGCLPYARLGLDGSTPASTESAAAVVETLTTIDNELLTALQAENLAAAGLGTDVAGLGLNNPSDEAVHRLCRSLEERREALLRNLEAVNARSSGRIIRAVQGSDDPAARRLLHVLTRIDRLVDRLWELRVHLNALEILLIESRRNDSPALRDRLAEHATDVLDLLRSIRVALRNTPYPLADGMHHSLERHAMPNRPDSVTQPAELLEMGEMVLERLLSVRQAALERLSVLAAKQIHR